MEQKITFPLPKNRGQEERFAVTLDTYGNDVGMTTERLVDGEWTSWQDEGAGIPKEYIPQLIQALHQISE